jgi:hypothetical protein
VLVRVAPDGSATDTFSIELPRLEHPRLGGMNFPLPFAPAALRVFDPRGYVWTAHTHEYRLVQTTVTGDTIRILTRALDPPALSQEQQDSVHRYTTALREQLGIQVTGEMLPRAAPLLKWFVTDHDGYLWVARATAGALSTLDLFDPSGRFLGEVTLPFQHSDLPPVVLGANLVFAIASEEGVPQIVRATIGKPAVTGHPDTG